MPQKSCWFKADGSPLSGALAVESGTYFAAEFNDGLQSQKAGFQLTVNDLPKAEILSEIDKFCGEGTLKTTAETGTQYFWLNAAGEIVGTGSELKTAAGGTFRLRALRNNCETISESKVLTINQIPAAKITEGSTAEFCETGKLSAEIAEDAVYEWFVGEQKIGSEIELSVKESGVYRLKIRRNDCESDFAKINVKVNRPEEVEISAAKNLIYAGQSVILKAKETAGRNIWLRNAEVFAENEAQISISDSAAYSLKTVFGPDCERFAETTSLTVLPLPVLVFEDGKIRITGLAEADADALVSWFKDGKSVTFAEAKPTESGEYEAEITLADGSVIRTGRLRLTQDILGTEDEPAESDLKIYPNPSEGSFRLRSGAVYRSAVLKIYNSNGQLIREKTFAGNRKIDTEIRLEVTKGLYYLRLETEAGNMVRKLIIK